MARPLALFDIDKTMFDGPTYVPVMQRQVEDRLIDQTIVTQTDETMNRYNRGFIGYEDFVREVSQAWAKGLEGKSVEAIEGSADRFFDSTNGFFGYVKPTVGFLKPTHEIVLTTGSPQFTARAVARVFGISHTISSVYGENDGLFTGRVDACLATRHDKREAIKHLTDQHPFEGSCGFGDSEGDIEMLRAVQRAFCIRPTEGLRELALEHEWLIIDSDEELGSATGLLTIIS